MAGVGCIRGASDLLVDEGVAGIFTDLLSLSSFQVRLLSSSLDIDHHFELFHGI